MQTSEGVKTFIGIDAHSKQCSIKAIDRKGQERLVVDVPTRVEDLQEALDGIDRPAWVLVEASTMAPFVRDALAPCVDRVVASETRQNRWVANSEDKSDPADADRLARLLRLSEYKEVHIPAAPQQDLRELMILTRKTVQDVIRAKNRIKSKFRQHGVAVTGTRVYTTASRTVWLDKIKRPAARFMLDVLYTSLDAAESAHKRAVAGLLKRVRRVPAYKRLLTVPGFGPVVAPIVIAVIDDPWRFAQKRKLWSYAGLGVRRRYSGDPTRAQRGGSRNGNRLLKYAAMLAAHTAIRAENRFAHHYRKLVASGTDATMAARTVARNILATALAIWKSETTYRDSL